MIFNFVYIVEAGRSVIAAWLGGDSENAELAAPALLPNRKDRFAPSKVVFRRIPTG